MSRLLQARRGPSRHPSHERPSRRADMRELVAEPTPNGRCATLARIPRLVGSARAERTPSCPA
eukprot:CAMPEP_0176290424 /NCGR_PEP_ID=MMETSP0121_2-20121125/55015_1 /TAXON_ID=160619 /ORGANISM="Kryptoperidinium foliaceum, Strain CCMP 1326" /LENGTH=62 /DNA_ID=CAMNT_0017631213 /DNA_START=140 /DNA_END=325 /DNA_ORIENTATION=+